MNELLIINESQSEGGSLTDKVEGLLQGERGRARHGTVSVRDHLNTNTHTHDKNTCTSNTHAHKHAHVYCMCTHTHFKYTRTHKCIHMHIPGIGQNVSCAMGDFT